MNKTNNTDKQPAKTHIAPDVVINTADKLYLAVAQTKGDLAYFVYMLVAQRNPQTNGFFAFAETEIASFKNAQHADIYAETVRAASAYQQQTFPELFMALRSANDTLVRRFEQYSK